MKTQDIIFKQKRREKLRDFLEENENVMLLFLLGTWIIVTLLFLPPAIVPLCIALEVLLGFIPCSIFLDFLISLIK